VPGLRGLAPAEASAILSRQGLVLRLGEELADPGVAPGKVSWQSPVAETQLPRGSTVTAGLSSGTPAIVVPDLVNLDLAVAVRVLEAIGLKIGPIDTVANLEDAGTIVGSRPVAGTAARPGAFIALTLSAGMPPIAVPNLVGLSLREARARIEAAGFRVGQLSQRAEGRSGYVLSQDPVPGSLKPKTSAIDLIISGVPR
jgi:serine/threonine-protein kinase